MNDSENHAYVYLILKTQQITNNLSLQSNWNQTSKYGMFNRTLSNIINSL